MISSPTFRGECVVFDLDGTLIDSEPQVRVSLNRILADFDRRALTPDEVVPMMGGGAEPMMRMAFEATGDVPDMQEMPDILARYLGYYLDDPASHTVVFEGVYGVLDHLRENGLALGICTNKPGTTTVPVLRAVGLHDYFTTVVTADDVPLDKRKPNGAHIAITVERMGADLSRTVYVGDSEPDVRAAHDAGVPCVLVSYGYKATELPFPPTETIDSILALPDAVNRIFGR